MCALSDQFERCGRRSGERRARRHHARTTLRTSPPDRTATGVRPATRTATADRRGTGTRDRGPRDASPESTVDSSPLETGGHDRGDISLVRFQVETNTFSIDCALGWVRRVKNQPDNLMVRVPSLAVPVARPLCDRLSSPKRRWSNRRASRIYGADVDEARPGRHLRGRALLRPVATPGASQGSWHAPHLFPRAPSCQVCSWLAAELTRPRPPPPLRASRARPSPRS